MVDTKKLEEVATLLNKQSDSLNKTLQKIQDKLNSLNVGLEAWASGWLSNESLAMEEDSRGNIITPFPGATSRARVVFCGYARTGRGWGLAIRPAVVYYDAELCYLGEHNGDPQPLLEAPRDIRIAALEHIPEVIGQLQEKAEQAIEAIEKAKVIADEL